MGMKIKKDDEIIVLAGKDKGRTGKVLRVLPKAKKVLIEGVNLVKKHKRPNPQKNEQGGIVEKEMPLAVSNVAILNPVTKKADRVWFKHLEDGRKVRCFRSNNEQVDI